MLGVTVENLGVRGETTATSPPWLEAQTISSDTQGDDDHRSQGQGQKRVYGSDSGSNSKGQRGLAEGFEIGISPRTWGPQTFSHIYCQNPALEVCFPPRPMLLACKYAGDLSL